MLRHKRHQLERDSSFPKQQEAAASSGYTSQNCDLHSNNNNSISKNNYTDEDEEDRRWRETARMLADHQELDFFGRSRSQRGVVTPVPDDEDEHSSDLSVAQSGCHSILAAWNMRSSSRASRHPTGPRSILSGISNATSKRGAGKRGKSPASQTRIPLGPKNGQHFVTNTRRRRQASELILNTVEARRQTLEAQRMQIAASLLGESPSYLAPQLNSTTDLSQQQQQQQQQQQPHPNPHHKNAQFSASHSPSPSGGLSSNLNLTTRKHNTMRTPSPAMVANLLNRKPRASEAQRNRLLLTSARPPLAKLDQNSSDLCSSNESSLSSRPSSSCSSDSSSRFTQLVTAEPAPRLLKMDAASVAAENKQQRAKPAHPNVSEDLSTSRLRRGALRRDSIRRLRLDRSKTDDERTAKVETSNAANISSSDSSSTTELTKLPPARKLDIKQNPFLNRHHFRTSSARVTTTNSRQQEPTRSWTNSPDSARPIELIKEKPVVPPRPRSVTRNSQTSRPSSSDRSFDPQIKEQHLFYLTKQQQQQQQQVERPIQIEKPDERKAKFYDEDNVKQVERMLRDMRPNQTMSWRTTSIQQQKLSATKRSTGNSAHDKPNPLEKPQQRQTSMRSTSLEESESARKFEDSSTHSTQRQNISGNTSRQYQQTTQEPNDRKQSKNNQDLTTNITSEHQTDLVRKQIIEKWRIETETREMRLREQEQKNQQVEEARPTSISPPIKFADPHTRKSQTSKQQRPDTRPPSPPVITSRKPSPNLQPMLIDCTTKYSHTTKMESNDTNMLQTEQKAANEFKTRVDQPNEKIGSSRVADIAQPKLTPTTRSRPSSIYWRGPVGSELSELFSPIEKKEELEPNQRRALSPPPVISQQPIISVPRRGQSQSNLASRIEKQYQPVDDQAIINQQTSGSAVRLMVKEKKAPQLDYAFVEPRPAVLRATTAVSSQSTRLGPQPKRIVAPDSLTARARSPLQISSPRSPEFNNPASSSNDDSAIASSVSSPSSLSLTMMNSSANRQPASKLNPVAPTQGILRRQHQNSLSQSDCSDSPDDAKLKRVSTQLEQQQLPLEPLFRSDARSPDPLPLLAKVSQSSVIGSPAKRVHFNDRTSVRSFESISSLASNSTAVPTELLRQQLGSPDSLESGGSGSGLSRLSAESPDLRKTSGAAIYAVRGDPELEIPVRESPVNPLRNRPIQHQQQQQPSPQSQSQSQFVQLQPHQQQQRYPLIRSVPAPLQPAVQSPYLPTTHALPQTLSMNQARENNFRRENIVDNDDAGDTEYALRMRQAANSRVFGAYVAPPPPPPAHSHQASLTQRRVPNFDVQLLNFQTEV